MRQAALPTLFVILLPRICSSAKRPFFSGVECGELLELGKYLSGCRWVLSNIGKGPTNLRQVALPALFVILLPFVCSSAKQHFLSGVKCHQYLRLGKHASGRWWVLS
jgi:hypothetical protein